ncbi:MAG: glutamate--tRNA ligase [Candidatus Zixiibacteriota bacterium]|jgi:glutamyl-tRNA synthetase
MPKKNVRVRFAPAPTGYLHVGGARTALFNYLFARQHHGKFVLRIEDTDAERSSEEYYASIVEALRWLGLDWDEGPEAGGPHGPYRQSERRAIYDEHIGRLVEADAAYECYCTPEELDRKREAMRDAGQAPRYDGACAGLTAAEREEKRAAGQKPCLRFRMDPAADLAYDDLIRGRVEIKAADLDDFVIARPDGSPTYNFVCAVDDTTMAISHVIRGEDHISNTPRQIAVYRALGAEPPVFAHVPLLLGPDKSRLSKRHGAKAVLEYRDEGFLPEAFVNFLALLGWSYDDEREFFSLKELKKYFSLERVAKKGAVFDVDKLTWMNGSYLRQMSPADVFRRARPLLVRAGLVGEEDDERSRLAEKALALEHEKLKTLRDAPDLISFFFSEDVTYDDKAKKNLSKLPGGADTLRYVAEACAALPSLTAATLEEKVRAIAEEKEMGAGKIIHAVRAALSGRATGPSLFEMAALMGQERVVKRIMKAASSYPSS